MVEMSVRQRDRLKREIVFLEKGFNLRRIFARINADCRARFFAGDDARVLLKR